jgi:hypothetical protein
MPVALDHPVLELMQARLTDEIRMDTRRVALAR